MLILLKTQERNAGGLGEAGKGKKQNSTLEPPGGSSPADTLALAQED